jgi:hypothetical protein
MTGRRSAFALLIFLAGCAPGRIARVERGIELRAGRLGRSPADADATDSSLAKLALRQILNTCAESRFYSSSWL